MSCKDLQWLHQPLHYSRNPLSFYRRFQQCTGTHTPPLQFPSPGDLHGGEHPGNTNEDKCMSNSPTLEAKWIFHYSLPEALCPRLWAITLPQRVFVSSPLICIAPGIAVTFCIRIFHGDVATSYTGNGKYTHFHTFNKPDASLVLIMIIPRKTMLKDFND